MLYRVCTSSDTRCMSRSASSAVRHAAYLSRLPPPQERRSIRERAGLSQSQLARDLRVSVTAVRLWESGERGFSPRTIGPYVELLEALSEVAPKERPCSE